MGYSSKYTILALAAVAIGAAMPTRSPARRQEWGQEYVAISNGTAPTIINPNIPQDNQAPQATQNQPPIISGAPLLTASIVSFCLSALFWGCVYMNRRQIYTRVYEPLRESLLGPTSRADARSAQSGDVEMATLPVSHSVVSPPPSSHPSSDSRHPLRATSGNITEGNAEGNYRNV